MKKVITVKMFGYPFEDLSERSQEIAILGTAEFWISICEDSEADYSRIEKAIDEANRLQTPHFLPSIVAEMYDKEIRDELIANDYLYSEDGMMYTLIPLQNSINPKTSKMYHNAFETTIENYKPQTRGDV